MVYKSQEMGTEGVNRLDSGPDFATGDGDGTRGGAGFDG